MGSSCKSLSGRCYLHASQLSETEILLFIMLWKIQTPPSRNFHATCKPRPQHGHCQFAALSAATGGHAVESVNLSVPHRPHRCARYCRHKVGCVDAMPPGGPEYSEPRGLANAHKSEGSRAKSQLLAPPPAPTRQNALL